MKKLIVAVLAAVLLPTIAAASCTWTTSESNTDGKVVCTTVAETVPAFNAGATVGWPMTMCPKGVTFTACNDGTNALTAAATLSVAIYDSGIGGWAKYPDQNITTEAITAAQRCQAFDGKWTVVPGTRIAIVPTAGTLAGGSFTIWYRCN